MADEKSVTNSSNGDKLSETPEMLSASSFMLSPKQTPKSSAPLKCEIKKESFAKNIRQVDSFLHKQQELLIKEANLIAEYETKKLFDQNPSRLRQNIK